MSAAATTPGPRLLLADVEGRVGALTIRAELRAAAGDGPLVLAGPSGAGKTSLLLMLLGVLRPERGRVALGDDVLFDAGEGVDVATEDRGLGYVPQDLGLFPHLTALGNVEFAVGCAADGRRLPRAQRRARARALLDGLELGALADRHPAALSGGERQRVSLARALGANPRALLLDEPLSALDAGTRRQVRGFLRSYLAGLGLPAVVVTHNPADAAALGQRVAVLESGRLVQTGTLAELRAQPASPFVAELVAG